MKKLLTTACLFVVTIIATSSFVAPTVFGQEQKTAKVNPSPDESVTAKVDKLFAQWNKSDSPGCALGIVKDGRLIYKHGYGMANLDYDIPFSTKSVFAMASISKQFTAMSILLLAKQGKLSLDDGIQKYLPEIPRYQSPISIRHLIHHTSGIRNHGQLTELAGMLGENVRLTDDDILGLIARQKELNFKPGEEYLYSNSGYFLLGLIVRRVSGKSLHQFAEENIFKPLGMNNTHFRDGRSLVVKNRVTAYLPGRNGEFSVVIPGNSAVVGAGGLYSTVEDLFLWDQNFHNNKLGGGPVLISEQLSTGTLNNGEKIDYAFGLRVDEYKGLKTIHHGGSGGGFEHEMIRFPEQDFSVICLCNAGNKMSADGLATQVADIFLADQFKKGAGDANETAPAISIPEKDLASLAGLYFDPIKETTVRYYMKDGKLMIFNTALSPLSPNRFKVVGGGPPGLEIVFVRPIAGGRMQVKHVIGRKTQTWEAVQGVTLTSAQPAEFTGRYVSDELPGTTYTLTSKNDKLALHVRNQITPFSDRELLLAFELPSGSAAPTDVVLTPAFTDAFITSVSDEPVILRFTRTQQNAISGFTLSTGTVRRLRFNKLLAVSTLHRAL